MELTVKKENPNGVEPKQLMMNCQKYWQESREAVVHPPFRSKIFCHPYLCLLLLALLVMWQSAVANYVLMRRNQQN